MSDTELIRRAEAAGVTVRYLDWRHQRAQVPDETIAAILGALGDTGDRAVRGGPRPPGIPGPLPRLPERRSWGFSVQLYSVRSRRSWGHGDFRDLADLAAWSAKDLGAGFVLVSPLHAPEPAPPLSASPYLPMTRRYLSPLYLRVEDVPEYQRLTRGQRQLVTELGGPLRAASRTPELIDRDRVWAAKRTALELIRSAGMTERRQSQFQRYVAAGGAALGTWATWCALAERYGPDWRRWPPELADPRQAARLVREGPLAELAPLADFHAWLQWLADEQLAQAQRTALAAGMGIGLIADLAVGAHPGGSDAWAAQDLMVRGMSVGAPPDGFNQRGQDWAQPPPHPHTLVRARARPLADLLRAALEHAGGLRADHVMGLARLWWIPEGMPPERGAYVSYDHRLLIGTLAEQAAAAGALAIGEDLGTVDHRIRRYLARAHILGTEMAWFARRPDGSPLPPARWRRWCMATVGTHDVPPVAGFVAGDQVTVRARLGLLADPGAERVALEQDLALWRSALEREHLLAPGQPLTAPSVIIAMYGYIRRTPAALIGVALADAVGDRRTQNIPGTSAEYPNWRIPLCDGDGAAVLVDELADSRLVRSVVAAVTGPGSL